MLKKEEKTSLVVGRYFFFRSKNIHRGNNTNASDTDNVSGEAHHATCIAMLTVWCRLDKLKYFHNNKERISGYYRILFVILFLIRMNNNNNNNCKQLLFFLLEVKID